MNSFIPSFIPKLASSPVIRTAVEIGLAGLAITVFLLAR